MRKQLYWMTMAGFVVAAAGCANQRQNVRRASVGEISSVRHVGIQPAVGADMELGERTKAKVAAATTVKILASILGGGYQTQPGSRSGPPPEGYTQTDNHATVFAAQEADSFKSPTSAMAEAINRKMKANGITVAPQSPYSLTVKGEVWGLDYDKFSEKDDYRLYYDVEVDLTDANKQMIRTYDCQGVTQDKRGLDDWEANDKAAVKKDAAVIGDICADKALASMDLIQSANAGAAATATSSSTTAGKSSG